MPWIIQAKNKQGNFWEPVSVEHTVKLAPGCGEERRYEYDTVDEAALAFAHFLEVHDGLPSFIIRQMAGYPRFLARYDVRFALIGGTFPGDTLPVLKPYYDFEAELLAAATAKKKTPDTGTKPPRVLRDKKP